MRQPPPRFALPRVLGCLSAWALAVAGLVAGAPQALCSAAPATTLQTSAVETATVLDPTATDGSPLQLPAGARLHFSLIQGDGTRSWRELELGLDGSFTLPPSLTAGFDGDLALACVEAEGARWLPLERRIDLRPGRLPLVLTEGRLALRALDAKTGEPLVDFVVHERFPHDRQSVQGSFYDWSSRPDPLAVGNDGLAVLPPDPTNGPFIVAAEGHEFRAFNWAPLAPWTCSVDVQLQPLRRIELRTNDASLWAGVRAGTESLRYHFPSDKLQFTLSASDFSSGVATLPALQVHRLLTLDLAGTRAIEGRRLARTTVSTFLPLPLIDGVETLDLDALLEQKGPFATVRGVLRDVPAELSRAPRSLWIRRQNPDQLGVSYRIDPYSLPPADRPMLRQSLEPDVLTWGPVDVEPGEWTFRTCGLSEVRTVVAGDELVLEWSLDRGLAAPRFEIDYGEFPPLHQSLIRDAFDPAGELRLELFVPGAKQAPGVPSSPADVPEGFSPPAVAARTGLLEVRHVGYRTHREQIELPEGPSTHRVQLTAAGRLLLIGLPDSEYPPGKGPVWWRERSPLDLPWRRLVGQTSPMADDEATVRFEALWPDEEVADIEWFLLEGWPGPATTPSQLRLDLSTVTTVDLSD